MKIELLRATDPKNIAACSLASENVALASTAFVCVGDEIETVDDTSLR
jgi:hypothetical protein